LKIECGIKAISGAGKAVNILLIGLKPRKAENKVAVGGMLLMIGVN
jgi:hypothetical protein